MNNFRDYLRQKLKEAVDEFGPEVVHLPPDGIQVDDLEPKDPGSDPGSEVGTDDLCPTCPPCQFEDVPAGEGGGGCDYFDGTMWWCWSGNADNNSGWVPCELHCNQQPCLGGILTPGLLQDLYDEIMRWLKENGYGNFPFGPPSPPTCTPSEGDIACNQEWARYRARLFAWINRILGILDALGHLPDGFPGEIPQHLIDCLSGGSCTVAQWIELANLLSGLGINFGDIITNHFFPPPEEPPWWWPF